MPDDLYANIDVDKFGNKVDMKNICGNEACPVVNRTDNILGMYMFIQRNNFVIASVLSSN